MQHFDEHDAVVDYIKNGHALRGKESDVAMSRPVGAFGPRGGVEALTEVVTAAAWSENPQVIRADAKVGFIFSGEQPDEFGAELGIDVAQKRRLDLRPGLRTASRQAAAVIAHSDMLSDA